MNNQEYQAIKAMLADFNESAEPMSEPMAVYTIRGDLKKPGFLASAAQIAWRYPLKDMNGAHKYLDVSVDKQSFRGLTTPFTPALIDSLKAARDQGLLTSAAEARVLEIPSVKLSALWLHASGQDIFMPYGIMSPTSLKVEPDFIGMVNREAVKLEQAYRGKGPALGG